VDGFARHGGLLCSASCGPVPSFISRADILPVLLYYPSFHHPRSFESSAPLRSHGQHNRGLEDPAPETRRYDTLRAAGQLEPSLIDSHTHTMAVAMMPSPSLESEQTPLRMLAHSVAEAALKPDPSSPSFGSSLPPCPSFVHGWGRQIGTLGCRVQITG
jgi:hypothetical protein